MTATRAAMIFCVPALLALGGRADAGGPPRLEPTPIAARDVYSPNGRYVLAVNATTGGSVVYSAADRSQPLWTLGGNLMSTWAHILLSDDGNVVALVSDGPAGGSAEGLRLVDRTGVVATYKVDEIAPDRPTLEDLNPAFFMAMCGPPTPAWAAGVTNEGDRFTIQTDDGRNFTFRYTGEPVENLLARVGVAAGLVAVVGVALFLVGRYARRMVP